MSRFDNSIQTIRVIQIFIHDIGSRLKFKNRNIIDNYGISGGIFNKSTSDRFKKSQNWNLFTGKNWNFQIP